MEVDEALVDFVAQDPTQPHWAIERIERDVEHPLRHSLSLALRSVPEEQLQEQLTDPRWSFFYSGVDHAQAQQRARLDLVSREVEQIIYRRRTEALCGLDYAVPPKPYAHPSLAGIEPDNERLVPISAFERTRPGAPFCRTGYVFHLPPTLPAANSSYWLTGHVLRLPQDVHPKVRLDPFLVCELDTYRPAMYLMQVYGRPLDWKRLASLRSEEHGEWRPDNPSAAGGITATQICWTPRDDGIHFRCEEVPSDASARPARYAHGIYDPDTEKFTHADGALRYYSAAQLCDRSDLHLRKAGKIGTRVKLFRTDGMLARELWCDLMAAFFVWNYDVQDYFLGRRVLTGE